MKLITDLKNLSLQDKNCVRRKEELDIAEKKSLKEKCQRKRSQIVLQHKAGAYVYLTC